MSAYNHFYKQIPSRPAVTSWLAFIPDTHALPIIDSRRDAYLYLLPVGKTMMEVGPQIPGSGWMETEMA